MFMKQSCLEDVQTVILRIYRIYVNRLLLDCVVNFTLKKKPTAAKIRNIL